MVRGLLGVLIVGHMVRVLMRLLLGVKKKLWKIGMYDWEIVV